MGNTLTFNQCATLLNEIHKQATGQKGIAPTTADEFVSVAHTVLQTGYDKTIGAISQVLSRTIFDIRPYNRKFSGLNVTNQQFGARTRKLQVIDNVAEDDNRYSLENGKSVDQQKVNKPAVIETNFYGANVYQRSLTLFKDQLDAAFSNAAEFGMFISMVVQNVSDLIEKDHEEMARLCLANFIAGKYAGDSGNVVHLLTEYNAYCGGNFDAKTIRNPENYGEFFRWAVARIATVSDLMTERSTNFHINIDGKPVAKHTPHDRQKLYITSAEANEMESRVLSTTFHEGYLKKVDFEKVNYWQSIKTPAQIQTYATYLKPDGTLCNTSDDGDFITVNNLFGVLFDENALGYTTINAWSACAPFNASGGYTNTFWHYTDRYWNDFMENAVLFTLD